MDNLYLAAPIPTSPYDRIEIIFHGQALTARPIEFELDEGGLPKTAIKFETVNPENGQTVQFTLAEIMETIETPQAPQLEPAQLMTIEKFQRSKKTCPFLDPMELGIFKLDALLEEKPMKSMQTTQAKGAEDDVVSMPALGPVGGYIAVEDMKKLSPRKEIKEHYIVTNKSTEPIPNPQKPKLSTLTVNSPKSIGLPGA